METAFDMVNARIDDLRDETNRRFGEVAGHIDTLSKSVSKLADAQSGLAESIAKIAGALGQSSKIRDRSALIWPPIAAALIGAIGGAFVMHGIH